MSKVLYSGFFYESPKDKDNNWVTKTKYCETESEAVLRTVEQFKFLKESLNENIKIDVRLGSIEI